MVELASIIGLLVALIVSTLIIFVVTKLMGETEELGRAFFAALIGTVIYAVVYILLGNGLLAAIVAGVVWLLALKGLYDIGWGKAFVVAILIWILAIVVSIFLPTLSGPL
jgi:hypothetical protein